ncbi:MAG: ribosomal RNA small subunit methyltransferase A [Thermogutta sp.]|nr:ribosomal RNA small subunit methyltransferase A [Thermogutta sp.]
MPATPSPRQTLTFLRERLAAEGIRPQHDLGQNFLIDLNLLNLLADTAAVGPHDICLEVGTGTGSLTAILADRGAAVVSVELDPRMHRLAVGLLGNRPNVRLLQEDALKSKNRLHPALLDALEQVRAEHPDKCFKLVANLPYNVATPVIGNLLTLERPPQTLTATVQRELAERLVARPGTKDYGALSVWVQSQCTAGIRRILPPQVFWPRPKVFSAIVHLEFRPALRERIPDLPFFHRFVRELFLHRRKLLRAQLAAIAGRRLEKAAVDRILAGAQLDPLCRAEELGVEDLIRLGSCFRAALE